MPGGGKLRTREHAQSTIRSKEWDGEPRLEVESVEGADGFQELDRLVIAPHKKVLPIVHHRPGCRIEERTGAPAQVRLLFEKAHASALLGKGHPGRQPGKAATDNQNFVGHVLVFARAPLIAMRRRAYPTYPNCSRNRQSKIVIRQFYLCHSAPK